MKKIKVNIANHPVPDKRGLKGVKQILDLREKFMISENEMVEKTKDIKKKLNLLEHIPTYRLKEIAEEKGFSKSGAIDNGPEEGYMVDYP